MWATSWQKESEMGVPSMQEFAALGAAAQGDPEMRKRLRDRFIQMNGGDPNVDPKKLAAKIIVEAKAHGVRKFMPRPVVAGIIKSIMDSPEEPIEE